MDGMVLEMPEINQRHTRNKYGDAQSFARGLSEVYVLVRLAKAAQNKTKSDKLTCSSHLTACTLASSTDSEGGDHARTLVRLAVVLVVARNGKGRLVRVTFYIHVLFL